MNTLAHTQTSLGVGVPNQFAWPRPTVIAATLIFASALASLLYLWIDCPLTLSPDEAHYWDWSRNLDWSYYSKGPLVAWLIRGSCELLGPLSVALTGDLAAAIRFPAVLCHAALLSCWYILAAGVFRSPRLGLIVVAAGATLPLVRAGSVLMTIDPPFLACWGGALACVWRGLQTERTRWWAAAGVFTAFGILAKYTMALFPAAVVGYLLFHQRSAFRRPGIWLLIAGAGLGWVPVLVWNAQHEWVTFRHVFQQVGVAGPTQSVPPWVSLGEFVGAQFGMLFGFWLIAFLAAGWRFRPTRELDPGIRLLWWVAVPVWYFFAAASLVNPGQANWPAPSYVGGFILAGAWVWEVWNGERRRIVQWCVGGTVLSGLLVVMALHFPNWVRPTLATVSPPPSDNNPLPVRRLDPTARISGWAELADRVDGIRSQVRSQAGEEPVVVGTHWTVPGVLGCYCDGHPTVYAIGLVNRSDRHSQYDLWRPNPSADSEAFRGRSFIMVGDIGHEVAQAFQRIEGPIPVVHAPKNIPIASWNIWIGHGFRGFRSTSRSAGSGY